MKHNLTIDSKVIPLKHIAHHPHDCFYIYRHDFILPMTVSLICTSSHTFMTLSDLRPSPFQTEAGIFFGMRAPKWRPIRRGQKKIVKQEQLLLWTDVFCTIYRSDVRVDVFMHSILTPSAHCCSTSLVFLVKSSNYSQGCWTILIVKTRTYSTTSDIVLPL